MSDIITFAEAARRALLKAAKADPRVVFLGEGVDDVFGTMTGIADSIGRERVIEMPTSEAAIVGAAIGMAMAGKRPVVTFHRVEFALLAMEQIVNNAAKMKWISNGKHTAPVLFRLIMGRGWGQGPAHSQSLEQLFASIPGLRVIVPSTPSGETQAINDAFKSDEPTIIIEHRWCHDIKGDAASDIALLDGDALTMAAYGYMMIEANVAARMLERLGYSVDLFDLMELRPLRLAPIFASVRKTGRFLMIDAGHRLYGIGAEVVAQIACECFGKLKTAPRRIALPDNPTPSSRHLVKDYYPDAAQIYRVATGMLDLGVAEQLDAAELERELTSTGPVDQPNAAFRGPF